MARVRKSAERRYGDGSYWFDKKTQRHIWRFQGHTIADRDAERAKAKLAALKERLEAGVNVQGARQALRVYLKDYIKTLTDRKETTRHDYEKRADYYILPTLGDLTLAQLDGNRPLIKEWVGAMVEHVNPNGSQRVAM